MKSVTAFAGLSLAAALLALPGCQRNPSPGRGGSEDRSDRNWPYYLGNPAQTHYSTLDQINTSNVGTLKIAWVYDTGQAVQSGYMPIDMEGNPVVVDNRMWVVSPTGRLICLEAATGKEIWTYDPSPDGSNKASRLRGVSYWSNGIEERVFLTYAYNLMSIDANSGALDTRFGNNGVVDLRQGFDRSPDRVTINNVTPGAVYKDLLIMGSTGMLPGDVRAFDVRTGAIRWTFHTIPAPGEPGHETWPADARQRMNGANVWAGFALDTRLGIVYMPVASGGMVINDFHGADRHGRNRFSTSVVALDAASGKLRWDFQLVHHDLWDRDPPSPPTLVTVKRNGADIPALAQATKSGHVFILDRRTGRPLFPVEERPVPPSDIPGEEAWPTQPVPVLPEPFARQKLTADMLTTRTAEAHAAALQAFSKWRSNGQFVPPSLQGTVIFPGLDGGAEWGGQAYDPETGLLYINSNEMAWTLKLNPYKPAPATGGMGERAYAANCAICHGADKAGQPPTVPALRNVASLGQEAVRRQIVNGGGRMPGFGGTLGKDQIDALTGWLLTGKDKEAGESGDRNILASFLAPGASYIFDGYRKFLDPDGYPAITPPWGTLNALNVSTGKYVWRIPFGEYPELAKRGIRNTGSENYGGAAVTRGGLLFIGATSFDRKFHAFDKRTGRLLWETVLPAAGNATPSTYSVNGRQFVVIQAGGGKNPKGPVGGKIVAFSLPR